MAAARPWGDVFDNILVTVFRFLPCRADRVHMACVNKHWRAAVTRPPPPPLPPLPNLPPQLPWIAFRGMARPTFYSPLTGRYHPLCGLPDDVRGARWCGSGDGGWLILAFRAPRAHALYNLNTGRRIPLPLGITIPNVNHVIPLVLQSATLSSSPTRSPYYMVAATALVDDRPVAAFWCEGRAAWFCPGDPLPEMPQDVIYFADAFFFVTPGEQLFIFWIVRGPNGDLTLGRAGFYILPRVDFNFDYQTMYLDGRMRRYLVRSRGQLLMAVRHVFNTAGTELIRVYRLSTYGPVISWEHLVRLWDRMLFLGPGCSRCFEVAPYDGFEECTIYYLDEGFVARPPDDDGHDDDTGSESEDGGDASAADSGPGSVDDDADGGRHAADEDDGGRYPMDEVETYWWPLQRPSTNNARYAPPVWWLH